MWAATNLDNYAPVFYDAWSLEIQRNNIMCRGNQENPRHGLKNRLQLMGIESRLKIRSIPWLPSLEYNTVTFRADLKTEYEI